MGSSPQDPQRLRTPSRIPLELAKVTETTLVRDTSQIDDARFQEFHETDHIVEDLQSGTIVERWLIGGNPTEAKASAALQNFELGDVHRKHFSHYIVRREFRYHAHSDDEAERVTLMTVTWQRMPCPQDWAVDISTVLVSQQSWWSYDDPPKLIEKAPVGIPILRPIQVVTLRVPRVQVPASTLLSYNDTAVGRTNKSEFLGRVKGYWLLEDLKARHLYGDHALAGRSGQIEPSYFELALFLKGDPWRHHERWEINWPDSVQVIPPPPGEEGPPEIIEAGTPLKPQSNSFDDMRAAHLALTVFPESDVAFKDILPRSVDKCAPDELSKP